MVRRRRTSIARIQYRRASDQVFRNSVRDRQDLDELKLKAKPKTRAELKLEATKKPLAAE